MDQDLAISTLDKDHDSGEGTALSESTNPETLYLMKEEYDGLVAEGWSTDQAQQIVDSFYRQGEYA